MNEGFICLKCRFPANTGLKHSQRCDVWAKELLEQAAMHASVEADLQQEYQQTEAPPEDYPF